MEAFAPLIGTAAQLRGHHVAKEVIVLGDGAVWIWRLAARQFPTAIQIVDFYHASQHLWSVANARFGEGTPEAKAWVEARERELKQDQLGRVLAAIAAWEPKQTTQRKLLESRIMTRTRPGRRGPGRHDARRSGLRTQSGAPPLPKVPPTLCRSRRDSGRPGPGHATPDDVR